MKINIEKIKNPLKNLPKKLAKHPLLTFWILLFIALVLSGFVFYKYSVLVEKPEIETSRELLKFKQKTYQEVLDQWQQRKENLEKIDSKEYANPFILTGEVSTSVSSGEATSTPEKITPSALIKKLLVARNLTEFYMIRDGKVPLVSERAKIWEEKGLGLKDEYKGSKYQNVILLEKLKEELTG